MAEVVFSVSQVNEYIGRKIWKDPFLSSVTVAGEVTNFSLSSAGHAFFSLKDEESLINCVMHGFPSNESRDAVKDGALIKVSGRIAFYRKSGAVQLIAEKAGLQGVGDLYARFERIKRKLYEEGIFDAAHKKPLPALPLSVGVVTSAAGAVLHDIAVIAARRFEGIRITVYPVQVQGAEAPSQICAGIRYFNRVKNVDVIIVGRGGGSFEDLSAFNEESVARAVYGSQIPVVSAVGHETDYTLCDMAADMRAPTPSAAAELVVKEKSAVAEAIVSCRRSLDSGLLALITGYETRVRSLLSRIKLYSSEARISQAADKIALTRRLMSGAVAAMIDRESLTVEKYRESLENLNPRAVLRRGYAMVFGGGGRLIASKEDAERDMEIEFADGRVAVSGKGL